MSTRRYRMDVVRIPSNDPDGGNRACREYVSIRPPVYKYRLLDTHREFQLNDHGRWEVVPGRWVHLLIDIPLAVELNRRSMLRVLADGYYSWFAAEHNALIFRRSPDTRDSSEYFA